VIKAHIDVSQSRRC